MAHRNRWFTVLNNGDFSMAMLNNQMVYVLGIYMLCIYVMNIHNIYIHMIHMYEHIQRYRRYAMGPPVGLD